MDRRVTRNDTEGSATSTTTAGAPDFSDAFCAELSDLMKWRRDVRHFRADPVPQLVLDGALDAFRLAPSVGLSEPWRIVRLESQEALDAALANYETANANALAGRSGTDAEHYATLKLSGMRDAPVQFAVFCDEHPTKGRALGRETMPDMPRYSVVTAIAYFWLAARARGLGVGWVSILDPVALAVDLNVPEDWRLVAYLCVGWPETNTDRPELDQFGWETRSNTTDILIR